MLRRLTHRRFRLHQRRLVMALLPAALATLVLAAYFIASDRRSLDVEMRERATAIIRYLAPISEHSIVGGDLENLQTLVRTTVQQAGVKAAIIIQNDGRILSVSGRVSLSNAELMTVPQTPGLIAEKGDGFAFGAPIRKAPPGAPETVGWVFIEFDKTELREQGQDRLLRGLSAAGLSLLLATGLSVALMPGRGGLRRKGKREGSE